MKKLHNKDEHSTRTKPEGGLRASLCSNNVLSRGSPSGFISNNFVSEDDAIRCLADILVGIYMDRRKKYARTSKEKSDSILPSINEGAS